MVVARTYLENVTACSEVFWLERSLRVSQLHCIPLSMDAMFGCSGRFSGGKSSSVFALSCTWAFPASYPFECGVHPVFHSVLLVKFAATCRS